jgi:coenzyme Q-binding protein COQ10
MPQFRNLRRVRHAAEKMFDLVADVERYPEFVPLCRSLRVRKRTAGEGGTEVLVADMTVAYKVMRETFTSRVTLDRPNLKVQVAYLDGPFSHLDNRWSFKPVSETVSEVEFFIAYEFKSRVLGMLMGAMFEAAFRRFAEAFERRADAVYGRVSGPFRA